MIILKEKKPQTTPVNVMYRAGLMNFKETSNLPAIAKASGVSTNPKITRVVRQDTIFSTVQAMGIKVKVNAMQNVVAEDMPDQQTAVAVASTIYQQFGVKCSFTVTYEGVWKVLLVAKNTGRKGPRAGLCKCRRTSSSKSP
jgi:hypothetical protein